MQIGTPSPDAPVPPGQERAINELASLMAAPRPERDRIAATVTSWSRFPPAEETGRRLWRALAACSMSSRPEAQRGDLALRLYAITNGTNVLDGDLKSTLHAFKRAAAEAGCSPRTGNDLENALARIARTDPRPRTDWW